ncbi:acetyl-CoA carboxylase carboxyl transferase subunit beta [Anaerococcus sp. WCA-380-WT-2B]|uniref:Acetyl-CoA carboxylase carboxyl transferase subunit beta n=1 Tax=Anaerococcus porci TaxID=2652269 RepID=A0A6N7VTZ3_9FIRM|nr:acetyl-CoA carboxylase carboxyltransferase subunit beta [Anaerococcus porci]MSS78332.1 acetyl-CoA carboxylase carboxyl transferase subunit beta [Anaerococcus porci]
MSKKDLKNRKTLLYTIKKLSKLAKDFSTKKNNEKIFVCKKCGKANHLEDLKKNLFICSQCSSYFPLTGIDRFDMLLDKGYRVIDYNSKKTNPINFPNYRNKKEDEKTEAVKIARGKILGNSVLVASLINTYMLGSLGTYVGEEITKMIEEAEKKQLPIVIISLSGGARMQEGIFSLMQMAKISSALYSFGEKGGLYISLLTNPTMGGVSASFAAQGDYNIGEPGALIGFAGPRVIKETLREKIPDNFQKAENLENFGFLDMIIERKNQREIIGKILRMHRSKYGRL